jgi:hypothetical protein
MTQKFTVRPIETAVVRDNEWNALCFQTSWAVGTVDAADCWHVVSQARSVEQARRIARQLNAAEVC